MTLRRASVIEELDMLAALVERAGPLARHRVLVEVEVRGVRWPVHALELGPTNETTPILIIVGGVHGLERIGSQVALSFLSALLGRLLWDASTEHLLERARLWILPVLDPVGMARGTRSNGRGVDLMRNARRARAAVAP